MSIKKLKVIHELVQAFLGPHLVRNDSVDAREVLQVVDDIAYTLEIRSYRPIPQRFLILYLLLVQLGHFRTLKGESRGRGIRRRWCPRHLAIEII